jgi:dihydrofolate synthase/folylpolyglutamate synthase
VQEKQTVDPLAALDELSGPSRLGERPDLEKMRALLARLGHPERGLKIIHVGGTSGKGSTATILARVYQEAGYRVGLQVKPHLEAVEERFQIGGKLIATDRLVALLHEVGPAARAVRPSWFELTVAVAFEYFRQERVDLVVLEVGLGGTHDATNVVEPVGVVLTNVDLDHTEVLGNTVEEIAADKVGIFKPGVPIVTGVGQPTVQTIVEARAAAVGATVWGLGREIVVQRAEVTRAGGRFDLTLPTGTWDRLELGPTGRHQIANAALAVAAVERQQRMFPVPEDDVRRGLALVRIPGRLEPVWSNPQVLLDGAHNPAKMAALVRALDDLYSEKPVVGVLAFKRGHDLNATLQVIGQRLSRAVITSFDVATDFGRGQAVPPETIAEHWGKLGLRGAVEVEPEPTRALARAMSLAQGDALVCVTGSLYLVGLARRSLRQ